MITEDYFYKHIEEFYAGIPGWEGEALQLSAGDLDCRLRRIELGGMVLTWTRFSARLLIREALLLDDLVVGLGLEGAPAPIHGGKALAPGHLAVWFPGREVYYTLPPGHASLMIQVTPSLTERMGWTLDQSLPIRVGPLPPVRALLAACGDASACATLGEPDSDDSAERLRERVLNALDAVLQPFFKAAAKVPPMSSLRAEILVRDARRAWSSSWDNTQPQADDLAQRLGVSRRTLFRAFRQTLGLGPLAYRRISQLHALRAALLAQSQHDTTVTRLATELGFSHLGRVSSEYQRQFGERPSDTLRRELAIRPRD